MKSTKVKVVDSQHSVVCTAPENKNESKEFNSFDLESIESVFHSMRISVLLKMAKTTINFSRVSIRTYGKTGDLQERLENQPNLVRLILTFLLYKKSKLTTFDEKNF